MLGRVSLELKGTSFSTSFLCSFPHPHPSHSQPPTLHRYINIMPVSTSPSSILHSASKMTSTSPTSSEPYPIPYDIDIDDEELQAYAVQCAIFVDFVDIDPNAEEFASLIDLEEGPEQEGGRQH